MQKSSLKNINITQLDSGIKIISEKNDFVKSFSLGFWFNVGSRDETINNNGISHFLEHMFFKGTKKRSAKKIAEQIESLGGYLNAFTSKEHTCFYGRGLAEHIEATFEVLADMVQNSVFKQSEIDKEIGVVIDELKDIEDSPEELIFDKFESNIFNGNTLGMPIIGTEKNLRSFKRNELIKYIDEQYSLDRFYIVASGNINHRQLIKLTEKYLSKQFLQSSRIERGLLIKPTADLFVEKETQQVHYILGRPTYGVKDKKRIVVSVLSHILGDGSSSRLFQKVREENGIAYQINTFLNSFYDVSTFGIYLSTSEKSIYKAQNILYNELRKIKERKVSEKELNRAKEYLIGNMLMGLEGTTNRMLRIAQSMIYFNKVKTVEETIRHIKAVSTKDIVEISNELFENGALTRVILSSKNFLMHKAA